MMENKKMWYLHIVDFVGNEENWVFDDKAEAWKSFSIVLHKEMVNDGIKNKNDVLTDAEGHSFDDCLDRAYAETRCYIIYIKECELTTSQQFMW